MDFKRPTRAVDLLIYCNCYTKGIKIMDDIGIEKLWHVGICVDNTEYYFGKVGVCARRITTIEEGQEDAKYDVDQETLHNMRPDYELKEYGITRKTNDDIMSWLRSDHMARYQAKYYDTIENSCIAFATDFSLWVCGRPPPAFCYDFLQAASTSQAIEDWARANDRMTAWALNPELVVRRNVIGTRGEKLELRDGTVAGYHSIATPRTAGKNDENESASSRAVVHEELKKDEQTNDGSASRGRMKERSSSGTIFISGYSLRAPKSSNPTEFYSNLANKIDMVDVSLRYPQGYLGLPDRAGHLSNLDQFDNSFFYMNPKQVDKTEIGLRLSLECVQEALMDAMISIPTLRGSATGVYVGCCETDFADRAKVDKEKLGYEMVTGADSMLANRISYFYDLKGPSLVLDTACSSSLVALDLARQHISSGKIDRAIVLGVSITLNPHKNACFKAFNMLSPDGTCFSFDKRANGYCRSEGVFAVVLEAGSVCSRGGYAEVLGSAVNSDGYKKRGVTFPSGSSQCKNAREALKMSGKTPQDIVYIEAHGTGTTAGDSEELSGFFDLLYGDGTQDPARNIPIGSVKSSMGHCEGASGLASVAKCLLMMEKRQLLPNLHFESTSHSVLLNRYFEVVTEVKPWNPGCICVSNYGFGGTNACVILGPGNIIVKEGSTNNLLGKRSLPSWVFSNKMRVPPSMPSNDWFQHQVQLGNELGFRYRNDQEVPRPLNTFAFVFGGQGGQWLNMGKRLYMEDNGRSNVFRSTIDRLDFCVSTFLKDFSQVLGIPEYCDENGVCQSTSLSCLFAAGDQWLRKDFAALGVISYQIAIVNVLRKYGIRSDFVIGHSMGEVTAAYAAGVQSEKETIGVALIRSLLAKKMEDGVSIVKSATARIGLTNVNKNKGSCESPPFHYYFLKSSEEHTCLTIEPVKGEIIFDLRGKMAVVGLESAAINVAMEQLGLQQSCVACFNSPKGQTVSGPAIEIDQLFEKLSSMYNDLFWREINTDGLAFHSPIWEPFEELIDSLLLKVFSGERQRCWNSKWLSTNNRNPNNIKSGECFDVVTYHLRNITNPVFFQSAIEALPDDCLVIEVGSSQSLLSQVKRTRSNVGLLGFVKNDDPSTEDIFVGSSDLLLHNAMWEAGYRGSQNIVADGDDGLLLTRCSLSDRYPNIWDHSTSHRVFTWEDYDQMNSGCKARCKKSAGMALLDEVLYLGVDEILCRSKLSTSSNEWIKDHKVENTVIFPGVGFLELIFEALHVMFPTHVDGTFKIMKAQIKKMLLLSDEDTEVFVELKHSHYDNLTLDAHIYTVNDMGKVINFLCEIEPNVDVAEPSWSNEIVSSQHRTCISVIDHEEMYQLLASMGYTYGDTFKLIQHVHSTDTKSSGVIDASSILATTDIGNYCMHPCILDDVIHVIFPLLKTFTKSFVPVEFNDVILLPQTPEEKREPLIRSCAQLTEIGASYEHYVVQLKVEGLISMRVTLKPIQHIVSDYGLFQRVVVPAHIPLPVDLWNEWNHIACEDKDILYSVGIMMHMKKYVVDAFNSEEGKHLLAQKHTHSLHLRRMIALAKDGLVFTDNKTSLSRDELAQIMPLDMEMADRVGKNLVKIWNNPKVAQEVLFQDDLMANIYKDGRLFREREAMRFKLAKYKDIKGLRVLEVGAGTGGLTEIAMEVLDESTDYVFSDISPSFFPTARKRWGDRAHFKVLNLENTKQALKETCYDLIIGFDVVHATSDIELALKNIRDMLVPGGSAVIMDFVDVPWWANMCFGVFEGWFMFEDGHRDRTCYLDEESWRNLSETVGFDRFSIEHQGFHCVLGFGKNITKLEKFDCIVENEKDLISYFKQSLGIDETKRHHSIRLVAPSDAENASLVGFIRSLREEYPTHEICYYVSNLDHSDLAVSTSIEGLVKERFIKLDQQKQLNEYHPNGTSFKLSSTTQMLLPPPPCGGLGDHEVKIRVMFSSLNFKDVIFDLRMIDFKEKSNRGYELFGEIVESGDPSKFAVGDLVVGYAVHNFATSTCVVNSSNLLKVDKDDLERKSPKQMVANLVYYTALTIKKVAAITAKDTVLIHSATGGFGLSCVHLCKRIGCTIVATAGTEDKKRYLTKELNIEHVFNSRGDWFNELCSSSLGEGSINVVINSLAGNANIKNGILALAPFGRFCEVGKKDIYQNPLFDRSVLKQRPNTQMFFIDADDVLFGDACKFITVKGGAVMDLLAENDWQALDPLPIQEIYPVDDIANAIERMSKGNHIGRFILDHTTEKNQHKPITAVAPQYPHNQNYIITGGLGGLGIALAEYLCKQAHASSVTLLSRRGVTTSTQDFRLKSIKDCISIRKCDVSCEEDLAALSSEESPYAVFHLAKVLVDKSAIDLTPSEFAKVNDPKRKGLENLYNLYPSSKHIVLSSLAGIMGNFHQSAYSAASQWIEEFARHQPNVHVLNVGTVIDVGEIAETPGLYEKMKRKDIISDIQSNDVFESINWLLATDLGQLVMLAPQNYSSLCETGRIAQRYETMPASRGAEVIESTAPLGEVMKAIVKEELSLKQFDGSVQFTSYGLDSLSAVVLVKKFKQVGIFTNTMELLQGITADALVSRAEKES